MAPTYLLSIFLYTTYLAIFITDIFFYSQLPINKRQNPGYITGVVISALAFVGFNIYFFYQLYKFLYKNPIKNDNNDGPTGNGRNISRNKF